ncbi:hypothetical protein [Halomarina rubra]|uniref:Uncharacterized protein n=1 Tax=Halomarina rubra TaxID=2071873 RepID=A0ABD6AQ45_9EURY|nr:hypothetical protein [Halomarina rubra]
MPVYEAHYTFSDAQGGRQQATMNHAMTVLGEFQADGVPIRHLGTTLSFDAAGVPTDAVARFDAPTVGTVGWYCYLAELPISGFRRVEESTPPAEARAVSA